jgi:hypothetical protein
MDALTSTWDWIFKPAQGGSAHPFGTLLCTKGNCRVVVRSTPNGDSQYKILWRNARKCPHGCAPDEARPPA